MTNNQQAILELHALDTKTSAAALLHIETLDTLIGIYHHPAGHIAVNGIRNGKTIYKLFKSV